MSCPDENALVDLARGRLDADGSAPLEAHLAGCGDCRKVLSAIALATGASAAGPGSAPLLTPGALLGRYRIERVLGAGAMGIVYAAFDPNLDRRVALKLLHPEATATVPLTEARERILREAQALARLAHPNVVHVYELGEHEGRLFIAMQLSDGETLAEWLARASPSPREIVRVFVQAGRGLEAAHRAGLVHRDFKPQNVLIDRAGEVRVTDFGLARAAGIEPAAGAPTRAVPGAAGRLTQTGTVIGTPRYMAPEQFEGRADARSDQYAFCVALFEALGGEVPAPGGAVRDPGRPRRSSTPLWRALRRGMQVDPAERFGDMGELLRALSQRGSKLPWAIGAAAAVLAVGAVASARSPQGPEAEAPGPLIALRAGQAKMLRVDGVTKVAIGNPEIADVRMTADSELVVNAVAPGTTRLLVWTRGGERHSWDVTITEAETP